MVRNRFYKIVIYSFLATLILSSIPPDYLSVHGATTITKEFFESCVDTKFTLKVSLEDTWSLPQDYEVTVTITVTDMGGNQYLRLDKITVGVILYIEKEVVVNRMFTHNGDTYTTTITLKSEPVFRYVKPGETSQESFYIEVEGEVMMTYLSAPFYRYNSFYINIRAPPAPITISAGLPSAPIRIGDRFNVSISIRNDGNYPITDLQVEAWEPLGASIIGDKTKMVERLESKESTSFTLTLEAKYSGETTMTVYVSFKTITGYEVSKYDNKKDIKITISKKFSSITCTVSSQKVVEGDAIEVSGKLTPPKKEFVYLIIQKPDGKTVEKTLTTTTDGLFSYEFTPDMEGSWSAKARWLGDLDYENCTSPSVSFTVEKLEVKVSSEMGSTTGAGRYAKGSTVTVSISPTIIEKDFFTNYVFEGWKVDGEIVSTSSTYSFTIEKSVTLVASWRTEPNIVNLSLIVVVVIVVIAAVIIIMRRKH
jgi:hypothetical protein